MKKTKRFTAILLAAVLLGGCGNSGVSQEEYNKIVVERDSLQKELDEKNSEQNAESEPNIIFNEKYSIDGEEVSIILGETDKEISLTMYGHAKDREKAYLMFATFLAECKNIEKLLARYSVVVNMGELNITYMTTDSGYAVMGKNEDGTTVLKKPDWIPKELSELTMAESEIESYILELDSKILEFGEKSGYRMGVLVEEHLRNDKDSQSENTETDDSKYGNSGESETEKLIYEDSDVKIYYMGLGARLYHGQELDGYEIKFAIENLTQKTLKITMEETSMNGIMVDALLYTTVAPGKKAIDGAKIDEDDAEKFPMEDVKNIETKFHIRNDDDWKDSYDTENVIVLNEE